MITADYCSKELCLLLRKKGIEASHSLKFEDGKSWYKRYTQDVVCKWLREVHKIDIDVDVYSKHSWNDSTDYCTSIFSHGHRIMVEKHEVFNTYGEARESAIRFCVENLI